MKHENNTNIRQSPDTYIYMRVNQKVTILMKTKIDLNFNTKFEIKSHFAFLPVTRVFEKVMLHFELRNIMKIACLI